MMPVGCWKCTRTEESSSSPEDADSRKLVTGLSSDTRQQAKKNYAACILNASLKAL